MAVPVKDPVRLLVAYTRTLADLTSELPRGADSIYGDQLPPQANMAERAVVFRAAGGFQSDSARIIRPRIEVRAYGERPETAAELWWSVYAKLHYQENIVIENGRIISIMFDGGPAALFDQTLNAPFKLGFCNLWAQLYDP